MSEPAGIVAARLMRAEAVALRAKAALVSIDVRLGYLDRADRWQEAAAALEVEITANHRPLGQNFQSDPTPPSRKKAR